MAVNVFDVAPQYGYLGREDLLASIQPELQRRQQKVKEIPSLLKPIKGLLGADMQRAKEIYEQDSEEINQIISKENYSDIAKGAAAFKQKKLLGSTQGEEGAIETKYKKYYDWVDELNKSKADPELKEKLPSMILEEYNQRGGTTKGVDLNLPSLEEDQRENIQKRADDLGKELRESAKLNDYQTIGDWAKSKLTNLGVKYEDFIGDDVVYESYKIKGNEGLTAKVIDKIIKQDLRTNPSFGRYYEQKAKVDVWDKNRTVRGSGYNPEDIYLTDEENTALDVTIGNKIYNEGLNSEEDYKKLKRTAVDNYLKEKKINEIIDPYANTASKTYSFNPTQEISRDVQKLDFQINEEAKNNARIKSERKNNAVVNFLPGGASNININAEVIYKNTQELNAQLTDIKGKLSRETDPVLQEEYKKDIRNTEHRIKLKDQLLSSIEKDMKTFNIDTEYSNLLKNVPESEKKNLSKEEFTKYLRGEDLNLIDKFKNTDYKKIFGEWGGLPFRKFTELRTAYNKAIEHTSKEGIAKENILAVGNTSTYLGQSSDILNEAVKKNSVSLLNQDGSIFDPASSFEGLDLKTQNITPLRDLLGGRPGFAVTAMNSDGKNQKTFYVTLGDNDYSLPVYRQTGKDLINIANTSKYASEPSMKNQLLNTGYLYYGSGLLSNELEEARLDATNPGDKRDLVINENTKIEVTTHGNKDKKYYTAIIQVTRPDGSIVTQEIKTPKGKKEMGNEETLISAIGKDYYEVENKNINTQSFDQSDQDFPEVGAILD